MKINIHAGHNAPGKKACGAVGYIDESKEARKVKERVKKMLKAAGNTVHDCTVDNGISQLDVLNKIVKKCNANKVDLDISIHFNACKQDKGDGKTKGVEVLVYNKKGQVTKYAEAIAKEVANALGVTNRGVKEDKSLYFLRKTNAPALLVEVCFVDDKDDVEKYNTDKAAEAIVKAIASVK
ncbi:N-acetylmuramoyl-L-alanine amidase [[Clostridium] polysaccharolyticum]|uniref:N-acetylmuramoyl-L-alanine amidase n=1 Tax=[Clostridium] polysaccharolyticum TaxID=29364 RepID=A0A1H9YGZ5_9FIRM|nr:N-acetylmuramoyl-L-alanine amidase [[Clostridium] polysaccharolyticum]SES68304.1 N-acetylmuramoyl-L-alanine amidase [[Clostridium] polysaccharolyticum]